MIATICIYFIATLISCFLSLKLENGLSKNVRNVADKTKYEFVNLVVIFCCYLRHKENSRFLPLFKSMQNRKATIYVSSLKCWWKNLRFEMKNSYVVRWEDRELKQWSRIILITSHHLIYFFTLAVIRTLSTLERSLFKEKKVKDMNTLIISFVAIYLAANTRSSHKKCSKKKGVLRNFTKFTGKHLCQSLFFNKVAGLRSTTLLKRDSGTGAFLWILWNF